MSKAAPSIINLAIPKGYATPMTREEWLTAFAQRLQPWFAAHGEHAIPQNLKVSCGWPARGGLRSSSPTIGQCFYEDASEGKLFEIFISPTVSDPLIAGETVAHEVVHAIVGHEEGHAGQFRSVAKAIGLEGKMTQTYAGAGLKGEIGDIIGELGPYPHAKINVVIKTKTQTTRQIKISCKECGYVARVAKSWIMKGLPICACTAKKLGEAINAPVSEGDRLALVEEWLKNTLPLQPDSPITDDEGDQNVRNE